MDVNSPDDVVLRLAASAYLGRYTGTSRVHSESDLRIYLAWCDERHLAPLAVDRPQMELYVRWMQEVRRFKPSTVSRRMAVVTGFYRTCVIDAVLEHSPADYVRRPRVPPMSTTSATNTDTESCSSTAKAAKIPSYPYRQPSAAPSTKQTTTGRRDRSCSTSETGAWTGTAQPRPSSDRAIAATAPTSASAHLRHDHARRRLE